MRSSKRIIFVTILIAFIQLSTNSYILAGSEQTINFGKYTYNVKTAKLAGPGNNEFSSKGVKVLPTGMLQLSMVQGADQKWQAAEVIMSQPLGYGDYNWKLQGEFGSFPPDVVFGLFLYDDDDEHEYDVLEISKWGGSMVCMQCASHAQKKTYAVTTRELDTYGDIECQLEYRPNKIHSVCKQRDEHGVSRLLIDNTFSVKDQIHQKHAKVHINLWPKTGNYQNLTPIPQVLIKEFEFKPIYIK